MKDLLLHNPKIWEAIGDENRQQIEKWGIQDREPFEWLAFITEELGELASAISEWTWRKGIKKDVIKEAIQVATLAMKIAEMFEADVSVMAEKRG